MANLGTSKNFSKTMERMSSATVETMKPGVVIHLIGAGKLLSATPEKGFYAITALTETTFDVSECNTGVMQNISGAIVATTTDIVLPAGVTMYGNFQSVEISGGKCLVYGETGLRVSGEA